jgi:hypothetical protein
VSDILVVINKKAGTESYMGKRKPNRKCRNVAVNLVKNEIALEVLLKNIMSVTVLMYTVY